VGPAKASAFARTFPGFQHSNKRGHPRLQTDWSKVCSSYISYQISKFRHESSRYPKVAERGLLSISGQAV
jgi:hypothetical protein